MTGAVRAEWLKLSTTRVFAGLVGAAAAAAVLFAFIGAAQGPPPWHVSEPLSAGTAWSLCVLTVTVLAVTVGSRTVTEEFAHHTVAHTFIADPRRRRSILAKAAVAALGSMVVAAVTATALGATVYSLAAITGGVLTVHAGDGSAALGLIGAAGAMGVMGTAVGALLRQPVPAIVGALLWLFVAENLVGMVAGPVASYLPGKLVTHVAGVPQAAGTTTSVVAGALLAAFAAALTGAATARIARQDVL